MSDFPYTPFPFNVTPASPLFELSPVASNISQGWEPSCSTPECVPTTSWSTGSIGAALSFQFWGWDVAFDGNVKGNMSIELLRDGAKEAWDPSENALFRLNGQPTDQLYFHNITLKVLDASADAELTVSQARVNGTSYADVIWETDRWVIPSNDTSLSYTGFVQQASKAQVGSQTTYMSSKAGDTVSMQFNGSSFLLHGPCGPTNGLMKVTVDGRESTVNTSKPIPSNDCLLFQAWGFTGKSFHQLAVENVDGATLGIDRIEFFWAFQFRLDESGRSSKGAAVVVGVTIAVVFSILALIIISWKLSKKKEKANRAFKVLCL